jgi:putative membrane protein
MQEKKDKTLFRSTIVLITFYCCGVIGILSPWKDMFLLATPLNLMLSAVLLFLNHRDFNGAFYIFCFITFLFGYFIEVAGVHTGLIFGDYRYGSTFGFRVFEVPLLMGLNWLILIYSVGCISFKIPVNKILKCIIGSAMLVTLDIFLENVAMKYDFWSWSGDTVPLKNYVAWFICSFILLFLFHSSKFKKDNRLATAIYIVQLMFFILLNIF